jgi:hypothetical protein
MRVALAAAVVVALTSGRAAAEHEVFYRYTVLGYVRDATGAPVPAQRVGLVRDKTGLSYRGDTDAEGLFVLIARLGDESAAEPLTLRVGDLAWKVTARFDPANHRDERGTRVDLEGSRFVDRSPWFRSTLANLVGSPKH